MSDEIITAIVAILSATIGSIIAYFSSRRKNAAEIEKIKADAEKTRTETQKIKMELKEIEGRYRQVKIDAAKEKKSEQGKKTAKGGDAYSMAKRQRNIIWEYLQGKRINDLDLPEEQDPP